MSDFPKITIVMPSLNQSRFIEESIQSILDQNYPNLELIVLDGGSSDGSQDIIQRYSDHLAYWQFQPDAGQADALFQGFSRATGTLLGWINSDDVLLPGALFNIVKAYKSHPKGGIFGGNVLVIDENGTVIRCRIPPSTAFPLARYGWSVVQTGSFFTRKEYENVGGIHRDLHYIMDADLYLRMLHNNAQFIKVNAWLSGFRLQSLSKTVQHGSNFPKEYESVKQKYLPWIKLSPRRSRLLYICIQTINGNYIRMLINTWMAHGKYWRKWCKENLVVA